MRTAITGGIAEGKSTVIGFLAGLGYKTASADSLARQVFEDPHVNELLAFEAGESYPLTTEVLRRAIAARSDVRRGINRIMHPRILDLIVQSSAEFVEVPLLIESCLQGNFDGVWVVTCGVEEQKRRLVARYGQDFDGELLMSAQLPTKAKIPFADVVLRTNCDLQSVRRSVSEALARRFESG